MLDEPKSLLTFYSFCIIVAIVNMLLISDEELCDAEHILAGWVWSCNNVVSGAKCQPQ